MKCLPVFTVLAVASIFGACSPGPGNSNAGAPAVNTAETAIVPIASPSPLATENVAGETAPTPASARVIGLAGLGDLRIGEPAPKGGTWGERGAQTGDACRTVTSPDYPGAYAIVADGKVQRITVGQRSDVKLAEGLGVGATEKDVKKWFAGFREEPHKYEDAPAKYLTAPNAANGSSALRFEIGHDGKVKLIHVGTMPVLGYVEGCA
ncbi:MAG: hypothetical protein WC729_12560 [Sphingomonas sp.]|jgi:hypothetical protein|uniref:hypothetical protein n=1 Tax=Sphingomonas sp. TaxID=28214 RepID=UPI003568BB45